MEIGVEILRDRGASNLSIDTVSLLCNSAIVIHV